MIPVLGKYQQTKYIPKYDIPTDKDTKHMVGDIVILCRNYGIRQGLKYWVYAANYHVYQNVFDKRIVHYVRMVS